MKNIVKICLVIFCLASFCPKALAQTPIGFKQNTFTTNKDPSFAIAGAVSNLTYSQQYFVVSGGGESIANGSYFTNVIYSSGLGVPVWTNINNCALEEIIFTITGQQFTNWWLIGSVYYYPNSYFYVSTNGVTGSWTNYYTGDALAGATPLPTVTIAYTGALSYITSSLLQNAGGLTVSNVSQYADTNGEAATVFQTLLPPSNTNLATQTQLATTTNGFLLSLQSYAPLVMTNTDNTVYSSNPSHYLTSSATNGITRLGSNVVSSIINGSNLIVSSSQTSTGIIYTVMTNYSGGLTYITNINAVTLAQWGAFTTNAYSWGNYLAPTNDWTNAIIYTNGLISVATAAATFQPAGSYLTSSSNLNYAKFTNAPTIPSTNGLVTSNIFNGFATTAWVLLQNYLTPSLVSYYAPTSFVLSSVAPYPTTTTLNSSSNVLQSGITANSNSIALHWGTNQALVASILVNSNMTATFITNGGVITVTLGSTTNLYASSSAGLQPAAANLTNWSGVPTNQILLTPSLVTTLVAGNNTTVTCTTNSSGVHATVAAAVSVQFSGSIGIRVYREYRWLSVFLPCLSCGK